MAVQRMVTIQQPIRAWVNVDELGPVDLNLIIQDREQLEQFCAALELGIERVTGVPEWLIELRQSLRTRVTDIGER